MNKRLFALLSVLVLASMVLAACGSPAPVATEAPAAATEPLPPPPLQRHLLLPNPWASSRSSPAYP